MSILVTGSRGQLGLAVQRIFAGEEIIPVDVAELDITNESAVIEYVKQCKPATIINCAAYTAVDKCEDEETIAYKVNAMGPKNLARAASLVESRFIHISTDYVFDGKGTTPYVETDATGPISAYGRTKLAGENFALTEWDKTQVVRIAWLFGEGKNFVRTMLGLAQTRDEVSVVSDQVGTPTSALEVARLLKFLDTVDEYGIYHGTCEGSTNWADFTEEIFKLAGLSDKMKVNHITTDMYPTKATRPAFSILEDKHLKDISDYVMADWHDAISEYIREELNK